MFLKNIYINGYKSHEQTAMQLQQRVHCITGRNGSGKTNILDAVYHLLNGRSYFMTADALCVKQGAQYFVLKGELEAEENTRLMVSFQPGQRKTIKVNEKPVSRKSGFFGRFPCVVIAPDDVDLINGDGEQRRRFFDYLFSVVDPGYLHHLLAYNKALDWRNKQLKRFLESGKYDGLILEVCNHTLKEHGQFLFAFRNREMEAFTSVFMNTYNQLAGQRELPSFQYQSQLLEKEFTEGFALNLDKDRFTGRSNFGIHRDDWLFELNGLPLRKTGSQGQIKSYLIALKLAMYHYILRKRNVKSLLLLDDIFEKMDNLRMKQFIRLILGPDMGQVILTDTSRERVLLHFEGSQDFSVTELDPA